MSKSVVTLKLVIEAAIVSHKLGRVEELVEFIKIAHRLGETAQLKKCTKKLIKIRKSINKSS